MTNNRIENIVSFLAGVLLTVILFVDRSGFGPPPKVVHKRGKVITVYCLGKSISNPIYCKNLAVLKADFTDNNYKGKFYDQLSK